jgi:hypothetical protein
LGNEQVLRQAYKIAENKDLEGWVAAFTDDGTFTDESIGVTYGGPDGLPEQVGNYARAFTVSSGGRAVRCGVAGPFGTRIGWLSGPGRSAVSHKNGIDIPFCSGEC